MIPVPAAQLASGLQRAASAAQVVIATGILVLAARPAANHRISVKASAALTAQKVPAPAPAQPATSCLQIVSAAQTVRVTRASAAHSVNSRGVSVGVAERAKTFSASVAPSANKPRTSVHAVKLVKILPVSVAPGARDQIVKIAARSV